MPDYEGMPFQSPKLELNISKVGSLEAVDTHISVWGKPECAYGTRCYSMNSAGLCDLLMCCPSSREH